MTMSVLPAQVVIFKNYTECLNRKLFSHSSEGWKSKVKVQSRFLAMPLFLACRQLPTHLTSYLWVEIRSGRMERREGGRERDNTSKHFLVSPLFLGTPVLSEKGPTFKPHLTLITSLKSLPPNTFTLDVRASKYELWENKIQFITFLMNINKNKLF